MAQISAQHVKPLTAGFVALLVLATIGIGVLNVAANRK
jgi:hypothetical protein